MRGTPPVLDRLRPARLLELAHSLKPSTAPDHDRRAPRWPRWAVVCVLLPLGILGALILSATSTMAKAFEHGVPSDVQPAAVAMLEIVSAAGTLLAIFGATPRLRARAMLAVLAASGVSLVAGWSAYGWFGAVAPLALVGLVHLAAEAYQELRAERAAAERVVVSEAAEEAPVAVPATGPDHGDQADQDATTDELEAPDGERDARPVHGPAELVDDLRARPTLPSERKLLEELNDGVPDDLAVSRHRVKAVLRRARSGLSAVSA